MSERSRRTLRQQVGRRGWTNSQVKQDLQVDNLESRVEINEQNIENLQEEVFQEAVPKNTSTTLLDTEHIVWAETAGITLTTAVSPSDTQWYHITNISTGSITIDFNGETFQGSTSTFTLYPQESLSFRYLNTYGYWEGH